MKRVFVIMGIILAMVLGGIAYASIPGPDVNYYLLRY